MWQLCGADTERRFTWDMMKNDNHVFGGGFQPRARYDRYPSFVPPRFLYRGTESVQPIVKVFRNKECTGSPCLLQLTILRDRLCFAVPDEPWAPIPRHAVVFPRSGSWDII